MVLNILLGPHMIYLEIELSILFFGGYYMEEQTASATAESMNSSAAQKTLNQMDTATPARAETERRQAYGTAKTENLRDSGLWRIILPAAAIIFCAILFVIPLGILIPLLLNSIHALNTPGAAEGQLIWLWVTMIVIEIGAAYIIARGILRIFLTQAGNYR